MGIPAVKIGPRGKHRTTGPRGEEINIDTIVKAAELYALIALDICNRERPGAVPHDQLKGSSMGGITT
jgi:hypothetical protein